ncbi:MAG: valine--tRNA ligase [Acidobacteriales bacterium]|nr:valine--tRNA ligase [Terriglobales bacterium]
MSRELPKAYDPSAIEQRWAEYWLKEDLFAVKTPPPGTKQPVFSLLLPPPNVTGRLHMGHMLNQTEMDIIVRWHRMRGYLTLWLPGTDHAGIATQMMVERQLVKEGTSRQQLGRDCFVKRVWKWREHYGRAILDQMKRLGASVDWSREYFTMDENLSAAVREVFVRLYEEGLIYRGKYIVNWCPGCGTAISDLEVKHEDTPAKLFEIRYPVVDSKGFVTIATTRPETMLGDTAVAVNAIDERYKHLHGKRLLLPLMNREIPIILDELAKPEFGTGAVKVTPAHDPNDFEAGQRHNLPHIEIMDESAHMNENAGPYAGLDRFEARERVLRDLQEQGLLVGTKDHVIPLGKCDRCGSIVEPRLSTQWFVKIGPLAKKAIEVVESGEITFTPENYKQIYLNWMYNIHDWTISRQLWWGHRIPAWHCVDCKRITVSRETPRKCVHCGKARLQQDTDVLDTWFSSALLPFTSLGWPKKTRDLEVFYSTTLLITGFDILFFWVARMIMMGCHFMADHKQDPAIKQASGYGKRRDDSVPYREVYIHALVRDAERQKMSKTKGNVLDPIEVTEKYGTDAVRFTLASMASPGTDIAFNEERTDGYRAFANKIWNAARFIFMNIERAQQAGVWSLKEFVATGEQPETLEDRWILSRFSRAAREVNRALAEYRFHEAASLVYSFFWGDFCDWYIELVKPRLVFASSEQAVRSKKALFTLVATFEGALRLLSPFMPFITEELWHAVYDGKPPRKSIALAVYPQMQPSALDEAAEREMQLLQELITTVRNLRAEMEVETRQRVPIRVFAGNGSQQVFTHNRGTIEKLAGVENIEFVRESLKSAGARSTSNFDVALVYEKKVDKAAERERLIREGKKLEAELAGKQNQLSNQGFLAKAPAKVVDEMRGRAAELQTLIEKNRQALAELQ